MEIGLFRGRLHGGYLVDSSGFFVLCQFRHDGKKILDTINIDSLGLFICMRIVFAR